MNFVVWLFVSFLIAYVMYNDAKQRGYNKELWFLVGILFGIIGALIYIVYTVIDRD